MISDYPTSLVFADEIAMRPVVDAGADFDAGSSLSALLAAVATTFSCCLPAEKSSDDNDDTESEGKLN